MNDIKDLKKKILGWLSIFRRLLQSQMEKLYFWWRAKTGAKPLNSRFLVTMVGIGVAVGFFIGFASNNGNTAGVRTLISVPSTGVPFFQSIFGQKIVFPGAQADGGFIFANFERPEDVKVWRTISSRITPSTLQASEGTWSAKVTFFKGADLASVMLEDLIKTGRGSSDWSRYKSLQFSIYNPNMMIKTDTLTLLITDLWGKKYRRELKPAGGKWESVSIPIDEMARDLNLQKINQISFQVQKPEADHEFYFDAIQLLPSEALRKTLPQQSMFDYGFAKRKPFWIGIDPQTNQELIRVPFIVRNETPAFCRLCPADGSIPFPPGEIKDLNTIRIRNVSGEDLPFQSRVLARWPDGSVKWLALHFQATLPPPSGWAGYFLEYGPNVKAVDFTGKLFANESDEAIKVNTGTLEVTLSKKHFYLFEKELLDQNRDGVFDPTEETVSEAPLVLKFRGKEFRTDLDDKSYKVEIEEKGIQRIVVKASGWFQSEDGQRYCQVIVRFYFYQGKSYVKVSHTLVYTGYPENKRFSEYKSLKLPPNETIETFGVRIPFRFSDRKDDVVSFGSVGQSYPGFVLNENVRLLQLNYKEAALTRDGASVPFQGLLTGWFDISNASHGLAIGVRYFRENFPKGFSVKRSQNEIGLDLWPEEAGPLDLSTTPKAVGPDAYGRGNAFGLAKTHELIFYFHGKDVPPTDSPAEIATSFMKSLIIRTNPYWIDATGALGRLQPVEQKYATEEKMLARLFDWADRQPRLFEWYGMLNFGDTLTWWRNADDEKEGQKYDSFDWHPVGRWGWYNCEGVGTHTGALLQFARSGEWKYFEFGENLAKHIMDIDTVHYNTISHDKRLRKLDQKYSQVGAMHRHNGDHWGGRADEASHTSVVGILLYYYLTGNERAFDVAKEVGEYFLKEPFTYMGHPQVAPNRAMANVLWGDTLLYEATGDDRYKKAADKIVKIFLKGQQQDGGFLENYNPILHTWSGEKHELYMSGYLVGALISYHELTQDADVKEMFLKLVRYLAPLEYTGPVILHGLAYAYLITHDTFFIRAAEDNLRKIMDHQQFSSNPLLDGLIYEKPIYHRPVAFLSTVPYIFGALEEKFSQEQQPQ